jgi:hypothetical protein
MTPKDADQSSQTPSAEAAVETVQAFLHHAAELQDATTARAYMTVASVDIPAFDPRGLAGTKYAIGEPFVDKDSIIVPVAFADAAGQEATFPLVVVLEDAAARIDVRASVELMMGAEVHYMKEDETPPEE